MDPVPVLINIGIAEFLNGAFKEHLFSVSISILSYDELEYVKKLMLKTKYYRNRDKWLQLALNDAILKKVETNILLLRILERTRPNKPMLANDLMKLNTIKEQQPSNPFVIYFWAFYTYLEWMRSAELKKLRLESPDKIELTERTYGEKMINDYPLFKNLIVIFNTFLIKKLFYKNKRHLNVKFSDYYFTYTDMEYMDWIGERRHKIPNVNMYIVCLSTNKDIVVKVINSSDKKSRDVFTVYLYDMEIKGYVNYSQEILDMIMEFLSKNRTDIISYVKNECFACDKMWKNIENRTYSYSMIE